MEHLISPGGPIDTSAKLKNTYKHRRKQHYITYTANTQIQTTHPLPPTPPDLSYSTKMLTMDTWITNQLHQKNSPLPCLFRYIWSLNKLKIENDKVYGGLYVITPDRGVPWVPRCIERPAASPGTYMCPIHAACVSPPGNKVRVWNFMN